VIFLDVDDLLVIATRVVDNDVVVRDPGLLASAAARPMTTVFGQDAYPGLHRKTAALMHSIAQNHALVDGNKRLCLAAAIVFLGVNGWRLTLDNDAAYELVMAVASGTLCDVDEIAERLVTGSEPV
jgi:death-on-curing protein